MYLKCPNIYVIHIHVYCIPKLKTIYTSYNSLHASGEFCHLPIAFANSSKPDQDQQNVGLDLDPNCLTFLVVMGDLFVSKKVGKDQELIQSSTSPDPGFHTGK